MTDEIKEEVSGKPEGNTDAVAELTKRFETMEENFKKEQRISSQKDLDNKSLREQLNNRESERDLTKLMIATMAEQKGVTEDEMSAQIAVRKPDLMTQFAELEKKREVKVEEDKVRRTNDEYNAKANEIFEKIKHLPEDDENYKFVYNALMAQKPQDAEAWIKKMNEKPVVIKPTEEEVEEAARKKLEEEGQLTNDLPLPAGSGDVYTPDKVADLMANAHTPQGLKALQAAQAGIEKATKEGRLK